MIYGYAPVSADGRSVGASAPASRRR